MSFINIDDLKINYICKGKKGKDILLLHGWGQNIEMMSYIQNHLCKHFKVYCLDFPGFGLSDEPKKSMTNDDYVEFLHRFVMKLKINNPIIIAHSFGARVALYYAYKYDVLKMCLTGAAGIRERDLIWYIKTYSYKLLKKILKPFKSFQNKMKNVVGSEDYKNASEVMRGTLVNCVNFDIKPYLKDIKQETLLVFGEKDNATPLKHGKIMEKLMPNATLVVFENDDHFAYFNQYDRFNRVLSAYLEKDYD